MLDQLFLFFTLALPKAGLQLSEIPLTLSVVLFAACCLKRINRIFVPLGQVKGLLVSVSVLIAGSILVCIINFSEVNTFSIAQYLVVAFSPLTFCIAAEVMAEKRQKLVTCAVVVVGIFALAQFVLGISAASIEGITYTFGQDLSTKPIGYLGGSAEANAAKMVSTYQNGNLYGVFLVLSFAYLLSFRSTGKWECARVIGLVLCCVGIALSGSRTVLVPFLVVVIPLLISWLRKGMTYKQRNIRTLIVICLPMVLCGVVVTQYDSHWFSSLWDRMVGLTLRDATMTGRTVQWGALLGSIQSKDLPELLSWVFFGSSNMMAEGLFGLIYREGLIVGISFIGACLFCVVHTFRSTEGRLVSYALFATFLMFCVDGNFYFPPTTMLFFIFTAFAVPTLGHKISSAHNN